MQNSVSRRIGAVLRRLSKDATTAFVLAIAVHGAAYAGALPQTPQVVTGSVQIQTAPNQLTINQSTDRAAINWQSFSISGGNTVQINQPNSRSIQLDQVIGNSISKIFGSLDSNGRVVLANPNGVWFGPNSQVNVAGIVATTSTASAADMAAFGAGGNLNMSQAGKANAAIVNQGSITVSQAGLAAFVAPTVANNGLITARLGTVQLSSGTMPTLDFYGDGLISLAIMGQTTAQAGGGMGHAAGGAAVQNTGTISAPGGTVLLSANVAAGVVNQVINSSGVIEAKSVGMQNGQIVLNGGGTGTVTVAGTLDASGLASGQTGGTVKVLGNNVVVAGTAKINASGDAGGGNVMIGGDFHGAGPDPDATATTVAMGATIAADAVTSGNGGNVAVWSNGTTSFDGSISAMGGLRGKGGLVETSGHVLDVGNDAMVNTLAPQGTTGTWLLDPENLYINTSGTAPGGDANASAISVATLEAALGTSSVTLQTTATGASCSGGCSTTGTPAGGQEGDITVANAITGWSGSNSLTLSAFDNIFVNASITNAHGAAVTLRADNTGTGTGTVTFASTSDKISTSGAVTIFYNPTGSNSTVNGTKYTSATQTNYANNMAGGAALTPYMLVNTVFDLQNMQNFLTGSYALGTNINASATSTWNGGAGFTPIGSGTNFTGTFNGEGNTISGLTINLPTTQFVGLFGSSSGTIENVGLLGGSMIGGAAKVGSLSGVNMGTISDTFSTASVSSSASAATDIGGLVGLNQGGSITLSYATGAVTASGNGSSSIGGLVGYNATNGGTHSSITSSYATGTVSGANTSLDVGGLVGRNDQNDSISTSYATGAVSGYEFVGGLVGNSDGTITNAYAAGAVNGLTNGTNGPFDIGGLVGDNTSHGNISHVYSYGAVTANATPTGIGGLVGTNSGSVNDGFWDTQTSGQSASAGGATGETTAALQGGLPGSFGASWGTGPNLFPYFNWQYASTPQAVSGIAYKNGGVTPLASGAAGAAYVSALVDGGSLGAVTTGANGYYYFLEPAGTLSGSDNGGLGSALVAYTQTNATTGATNAARVSYASGTTTGFNIWGNTLIAPTGDTSYSTASATALQTQDSALIATAVGSNGTVSSLVGGLTANYGYIATGSGFTIDQSLASLSNGLYVDATASGASVTVADAIAWSGASALELDANNSVYIEAPVTHSGTAGALTINTNLAGTSGLEAGRLFVLGSNIAPDLSGVVTLGTSDALTIDGNAYTLISTASAFNGMSTASGHFYALDADLTQPTGMDSQTFNGTLEGLGHTVALNVTSTTSTAFGLFGTIGTSGVIDNLGLIGPTVSSSARNADVGALAGVNNGSIYNSFVTGGTITASGGTQSSEHGVGGLVGANTGLIMTSFVDGTTISDGGTTGQNNNHPRDVGGLVGYNNGGQVVGSFVQNPTLTFVDNAGDNVGGVIGDNNLAGGGSIEADLYVGANVTAVHASAGNFAGAGTCSTSTGCTDNSLSITASKTYDGTTAATPVVTGLRTGDSLFVLDAAYASANAGTAPLNLYDSLLLNYGGASGNYYYTIGTNSGTINPATVTLTMSGSRAYDGLNDAPSSILSFNQPVSGQVILSGSGDLQSSNVSLVGGVPQAIPFLDLGTLVLSGAQSGNYVLSATGSSVTITPAGVVVTAVSGSSIYGASPANPGLTATGLQNNEPVSVLTGLSNSFGITSASDVGHSPYTLTVQGTLTNPNYTVTSTVNGLWTINPATLMVTANAGQSKVYGFSDPTFLYSASGFQNGQTTSILTGALTRTAGETVAGGPYAILLGSLSAGDNYNIDYTGATFAITPAALSITANAGQTKIYGTSDPVFTYSTSGLVDAIVDGVAINDTPSSVLTGALTRTPGENVAGSPYAILQGSLTSNANYTIAYTGANFAITPAALSITANNVNSIYGQTPVLTYSETGLVAGDSITSVSLTSSGTATRSNVGNYTINAASAVGTSGSPNVALTSNYTITYHSGTLTIAKADLTITASDETKTYGHTQTLSGFSETGLVSGDSITSVSLASSGAASNANTGAYAITPSNATGKSGPTGGTPLTTNYAITYDAGNLQVNPAALTVTPDAVSTTYNGVVLNNATYSDNLNDYSITGYVNGQNANTAGISLSGLLAFNGSTTTTVQNAGTYTQGAGTLSLNSNHSNYTLNFVNTRPNNYVINPKQLTVAGDKFYDDSTLFNTAELSVTGAVSGETVVLTAGTGAATSINANTYFSSNNLSGLAISVSGSNNLASNYTLPTRGVLTIDPAQLTITAATDSKVYSGTNSSTGAPTYQVTSFNPGETELAANTLYAPDSLTNLSQSFQSVNVLGAGGSTLVVNNNYHLFNSNNYSVTLASNTGTITPKPLTVSGERAYDGTTQFQTGDLSVSGAVSGEFIFLTSGTGTTSSANANTYLNSPLSGLQIHVSGTNNRASNYTLPSTGTLLIDPAALIVTANDDEFTYDGLSFSGGNGVTYSGFVNHENSSVLSGTVTYGGNAQGAVNAGNYNITPGGLTANNGNYTITYRSGTLTIDPVQLTVIGDKVYDGSGLFGANNLSVSGAVDNEIVTLTGGGSFTLNPNVGNYTGLLLFPSISVAAGTNSANKNPVPGDYSFPLFIPLNIDPAQLMVSIVNDPTKFYDGNTTALLSSANYSLVGFVGGQGATINQTSGTYATANASNPDVVTASLSSGNFKANNGTSLSNYILPTTASGNGTINPAALTISATTDTKVYDATTDSSATPTYQVTSSNKGLNDSLGPNALYGSDNFTTVPTQSFDSPNVGPRTLSVNGGYVLSDPSNYTVTLATASGSITPAGLTVTADNQTKVYGQTFTFAGTEFTTKGLQGSDSVTSANLFSNGAAATASYVSPGPTYAIDISGASGTGLSNYTITYVPGTMTLSQAALTVTADNQGKIYGQTFNFAGTEFTAKGLVNGDAVTSASLSSNGAAATATVVAPGPTYAIDISGASGSGLGNYAITYVPGTLTISPAALTVTADDQNKVYGQTFNFAGTEFTTNGLVNGDAVTSASLSSNGAAATATVVAPGPTYAINIANASGNGLANYTITYVPGTMTINPAALIVGADDIIKQFGTTFTFAGTEFTTSGLVNGDTVTSAIISSAGSAANAIEAFFPIAISGAAGSGLGNYAITYLPGVMDVTASPSLACEPNCTVPHSPTGLTTLADPNFSFLPNTVNPASGAPSDINPQAGAQYCQNPQSQQCVNWLTEVQAYLEGNRFLGGQFGPN